jgi:hypothetical protein
MLVPPLVFLGRFLSGVERAGTTTVSPLVNFQVQQPPALPFFGTKCTVELVHHLFGNSYYHRTCYAMWLSAMSKLISPRRLQLPLCSTLYVDVTRCFSFFIFKVGCSKQPPTTCGDVGKWAGVSLNYTATSKGVCILAAHWLRLVKLRRIWQRQYDRLTAVTLHNVESEYSFRHYSCA